jgi:hypothetical protein
MTCQQAASGFPFAYYSATAMPVEQHPQRFLQ